ncbi:L,D-transpeptidase [Polaromonas sp. P1(28)-13]|nr:L,D-transpeptidase [Polaromonas sp. P1-6]UUZ67225.1 L,D-transpeptidase [Polaromonas sp. P2-4]UUZ74860.1 L,D-transpeptidase [Polaromonas sp. P1(28)-13]
MFVFEANGGLRGASPALLGLAPGDGSVPGIEQREVASLRADERTTPAGRFVSEPGHNLRGEAIVWFDYAARLAIHRLRPAPGSERRPERLASATPDDNRISLGCVVVPVSFYEAVVSPVLGKSYGIVYVLPEALPVQHMLGALQMSQY